MSEFHFDLDEAFPHLGASPIVEAVIYWMARPSKPFVADDLRKHLESRLQLDYPTVKPTNLFEIRAELADSGTSSHHQNRWRGFRAESTDGRNIVQFNQDGLVFSRLTPYENWQRFAEEGQRLWEIFRELGAIEEVQRLGVRFINRIPVLDPADVASVLKAPPKGLDGLGLATAGFMVSIQHDVPQHSFRVEIVQTLQPPTPQENSFGLILVIDVFTAQEFACNNEELDDRLRKMRWLKDKAFFTLLTKDAVARFQQE